jgi:hypothetical protein
MRIASLSRGLQSRTEQKDVNMKRQILWSAGCMAILCCGLAQAQAFAPKPDEVHKTIHVKVSVGIDGRVSDVAIVEKKVPIAIESAVLARVKGWQFIPVTANGVAVPALTYASFYACAMKSDDGYELAVKYLDNGPLLVRALRFEFQPVVSEFSKADQSVTVKLKVQTDGTAQVQDVMMVDVDPRIDFDLRLSVKHWVQAMHFEPEKIGGQPVATAMEWALYIWSDTGEAHKKDAAPVTTATASVPMSACNTARAARDVPRPVDNQFKQRGTGAAPVVKPPVG